MPARFLVATVLVAGLAAGCAQAPLSPREVAEQASLRGDPITAEELIKAYGVLTGRAAQFVDAAEFKRREPAETIEKKSWRCGEGLGETTVTEYLVLGEPYKIEVWGWHHLNNYEHLREEAVDYIYYGHEPAREPEAGLLVTDRLEIRCISEALTADSFGYFSSIARRPWRVGDGPVKSSRRMEFIGVGTSLDPGLGVHLHFKSGDVIHTACYVHLDRCQGPDFRNDLLGQVLRRIADDRNYKFLGDR